MSQFPLSDASFRLAAVAVLVLCVFLFWLAGYNPRRAPLFLQRNARTIAGIAVTVAVAAHALMLAPPPPAGTECVDSRHLWGPLTMVTSCDSDAFALGARHPGYLSTPDSVRQSRPAWIMLASLVTLAEVPYGRRLPPEWFAYVGLNFVVLIVALMVFRRLNTPASTLTAVAVCALGAFLLFNNVVKGFFWSAHTQMWNVLMPLTSISLSLALLSEPVRSWRFMAATGALLGIGTLAYGSLVVCLASAVIAIVLGIWIKGARLPWASVAGKLSLFAGTFAAPTLIWVGIMRMTNGAFYAAEVAYFRQFVWVFDSWNVGGARALLHQAQVFGGYFLTHLWNGLWPALVLLAIALGAGAVAPQRLAAAIRERAHTLLAAAITAFISLVFFYLMGFYRERLAFNIVVPIIVVASVIVTALLERMPRQQAVATVLLVIAAAAGYVVAALVRVGVYV